MPSLSLMKNASALKNRHGVYYGNGPDSMGHLLLGEMEGLVKKKGKLGLNPEEKHTVYEIEDLMDMDILPTIFAAHKESLDELQELYDMIITCQTEVSTELEIIQDMQEWSIKHEESHKECRLTEYVWWTLYKKECTEYTVYKRTIKEPEAPPHAKAPTDDWIDWLKENDAYYCPLYEVIKEQWEECTEARQNWTKVHEECTETQTEWEQHFCTMRTKALEVCKSYNECYDSAVTRYNERAAALKILMQERIDEFTSATKVECIWEAWEWSEDPCVINETLVETCYETEPNVTNITVIWPEIPEPLPCDVDFVDPYPCEEGWYDAWYNTLDISQEMLGHVRDNCHACVNISHQPLGVD